jgi:hypothetical protein
MSLIVVMELIERCIRGAAKITLFYTWFEVITGTKYNKIFSNYGLWHDCSPNMTLFNFYNVVGGKKILALERCICEPVGLS